MKQFLIIINKKNKNKINQLKKHNKNKKAYCDGSIPHIVFYYKCKYNIFYMLIIISRFLRSNL